MRAMFPILTACAALAVAGCATDDLGYEPEDGAGSAMAELRTAAGADVGRATVSVVPNGLRVLVEARNMTALQGAHGVHVHMVGRCDAPGFTSAGEHWNPTGRMHGSMNPQGPHAGDLPNLIIGTNGSGTIGIDLPGATLSGANGLLDGDGATIMIHAQADDLRTDPSGNSGGRIACGVFRAS